MLKMWRRKALTKEVGSRYIKATKKNLDEFCTTTNYRRVYQQEF